MKGSNSSYRPAAYYLLFLLLIAALAYWPLTFHVLSLKNDALNYFLPVRRLVSESYHQGQLPLWTPYLNLGYPLHGDMQSGVWNPFVQLFSLFGPYTLYMLQLETLLYIWLGGTGMFFLLKQLGVHPFANLLGAVAFMLCGFNSDSCQFLNWIAGTALLPFVFLFYYRCLTESSIRFGLYTGAALFFLFTCAYPADFILTVYLLAALLIVTLVNRYRQKTALFPKGLIMAHVLLVAVFLVLSAPAILSFLESLPLQERGKGASYEEVMSNPLHPAYLSSFTTPLSVWKMPGLEPITDPLERNSYIGIGAFVFALAAFFTQSGKTITRFSKWAALLFLIFSLGEMGGLRIFSYHVLPLMKTFRHPANAKMFTLFFLCILAALQFDQLVKNQINNKAIRRAFMAAALLMAVFFIYACFYPFGLFTGKVFSALFHPAPGESWLTHLKAQLSQITFADIVLLNTVIQAFFITALYYCWVKKNKVKAGLVVAIVNSFVFTLLFLPFTVVKAKSAASTQALINSVTAKGYPVPDLKKTLAENSRDNEIYMAELGCQNLYNKKTGRSDYRITPSNLLVQNEFWQSDTAFREKMMQYPLLYRSEALYDWKNWGNAAADTLTMWAFQHPLKHVHEFGENNNTEISISHFSPGHIKGTIRNPAYSVFVFMQNYYPRWQLRLNGKPAPITLTNKAFMGFDLAQGQHSFEFVYSSRGIKPAFIISSISLLLLLVFVAFTGLRKNEPR